MSEDSGPKTYCFPGMEDQDGPSGISRLSPTCSSMPRGPSGCSSRAQLHRLGVGYSQGGSDLGRHSESSDSSSQGPPASPRTHRKSARSRSLPEEDVEMKSSGSSGSGTESHGNESHSNHSHGNDSHGNESTGSSNGNSKDSVLLESSGSNKSSNSHSLSPPSSSNAFSLLSSEQDNPSTSGCSSEESAKAKTQKELIKTLKELKLHLPSEKSSKSTTLSTLKYALRCVKQVEVNEEYYHLLMTNDNQPSGLDVSSYTIEEIDSITSEYTLKNNDTFAVAMSLISGRIVYISDQAASILNCKREVFKNAKLVEFLTLQDVGVFYSFTTPYQLPSWSMCTGAESSPPDCMQEKSFFCRISGAKQCGVDAQYYPFRMTPYLMKVQDTEHAEDQFCCLLLAERVYSGYDAPRIPTDKRVFTTTHTPSCVFQDVDERAVPLLGYLPQDLIGTPVLLHLHPNDRPIMLAIHRKILQYAGQPFDHSSIRFCARNGEYIMLDTSWSSFVNPWSRKVSFVIGRHKVRTGPVNEDVFVAPPHTPGETKATETDIQEITEKIHKLLLQPVHNSGSSGYGSLGSNDHMLGMTSSSESISAGIGNKTRPDEEGEGSKAKPRTFQEICKGIQLQKSQEQQVFLASPAKPPHKRSSAIESVQKSSAVVRPKESTHPLSWKEAGATMEESRASFPEELAFNDQIVYSYQQISCLDSVIRYLESCNIPVTMKRKCQSSSNTASSHSDEDRRKGPISTQVPEEPAILCPLNAADKKPSDSTTTVVGTSLPLPVPNKPESVMSITSQCSYSSTIVHVGDKKPQPESEIIGDVCGAGETIEGSLTPALASGAVSPPSQERECYKKLGLTKQVLAAHTQKEEQSFLYRFREITGVTSFKSDYSQHLERKKGHGDALPAGRSCRQGATEPGVRRGGRVKKAKSKRAKQTESSDSAASRPRRPPRLPLEQGLKQTSWSPSDTSQSAFPLAYPPGVLPAYPLQVDPSLSCSQAPPIHPLETPVVALVLPNYLFPQLPQQVYYQAEAGGFPAPPQHFIQTAFAAQPQCSSQSPFVGQTALRSPPFPFPTAPDAPRVPGDVPSRSSTPQSARGCREQPSPPLFQSRCSYPLQLNLLQLEESLRSVERQDSAAPSAGGQGNGAAEREKGASGGQAAEQIQQASSPGEGNNSDGNSSISDMLDILLHKDSRSGTGSATSGSMGSGFNGCGTSASGTSNSGTSKSRTYGSRTSGSRASAGGTSGSGTGSANSSKYFGSVDSSQNSQKVKGHPSGSGVEQRDQFIKYVLQDPLWLLAANAEEEVMMTYQLPSRDVQRVLREDREKLRLLQNNQPRFTEDQKRELFDVHPWMRKGGLPKAIDIKACSCCDGASEATRAEHHLDSDTVETEAESGEARNSRKPCDEPSEAALTSCPSLSPEPGS